jgi:hypothetical protein
MPIEDYYVKVPPAIAEELQVLMPTIVEAARAEDQRIEPSDLEIEQSDRKGMFAEAAFGFILFVGATATTAFTKKWVDEVLWPKIEPLVKEKSDVILDFLLKVAEKNEGMQDDEQG